LVFVSDEFPDTSLRDDWTETNPDGYAVISVHDGYMEINLDGYTSELDGYVQNAPYITQEFNNTDIDIMTRFLNLPSENITSCGLIFLDDSDTFIIWSARYENDELQTYFSYVENGSVLSSSLDSVTENPVHLRVVRRGNEFRFYYSLNGSSWTLQTTQTQSITVNEVGIFGTTDI